MSDITVENKIINVTTSTRSANEVTVSNTPVSVTVSRTPANTVTVSNTKLSATVSRTVVSATVANQVTDVTVVPSANIIVNEPFNIVTTLPTTGQTDEVVLNSTDDFFYRWDGSSWEKIGEDVYAVATTTDNGLMSSTDKVKLDGIATGADVTPSWVPSSNPNYISDYTVTAADVQAVIPNIADDTIPRAKVIGVDADVPAGAKFTDTTYNDATQAVAGLMSTADKTKLDGVANNADVTPGWVPSSNPNYITDYTVTAQDVENVIGNINDDSIPVSKIDGLGVASTTEDGLMSHDDKFKLNGIENHAQHNVQSDWAESDTTDDAYISGKPTKLSEFQNDLTLAPTNAEQNVQSDWNATSGDAFINNKPTALSDFTLDMELHDIMDVDDTIAPKNAQVLTWVGTTAAGQWEAVDATGGTPVTPTEHFTFTVSPLHITEAPNTHSDITATMAVSGTGFTYTGYQNASVSGPVALTSPVSADAGTGDNFTFSVSDSTSGYYRVSANILSEDSGGNALPLHRVTATIIVAPNWLTRSSATAPSALTDLGVTDRGAFVAPEVMTFTKVASENLYFILPTKSSGYVFKSGLLFLPETEVSTIDDHTVYTLDDFNNASDGDTLTITIE